MVIYGKIWVRRGCAAVQQSTSDLLIYREVKLRAKRTAAQVKAAQVKAV